MKLVSSLVRYLVLFKLKYIYPVLFPIADSSDETEVNGKVLERNCLQIL